MIYPLRRTLRPRPTEAPPGFVVWNAPRPLMGNVTFCGDFFEGRFYACVDPADTEAARWHAVNGKMAAVVVEYVPAETVTAWIAAKCIACEVEASFLSREEWERMYLNENLRGEIELP